MEELVAAIEQQSAERVLGLVHRFQAEGRNLQHFCREAIRHFRNLLVARVCGADSDLIAATPEQRPGLERAAAAFSEEDLTRYFQILLDTDDDLRRKPDPRLHLEMGLLRMVNAARLAPLEEVLAEMRGEGGARTAAPTRGALGMAGAVRPADAKAQAAGAIASGTTAAPQSGVATARGGTAAATGNFASGVEMDGDRSESQAIRSGVAARSEAPAMATQTKTAEPAPSAYALTSQETKRAGELDAAQVEGIKDAILRQQKFLAEIVEHVRRWELDGADLRLYFAPESRTLADMLNARGPIEKLRTIASEVLGAPVRVCVKLDTAQAAGTSRGTRAPNESQEMRAQIEQDPIVRAMLERFGGQISQVRRRGED